MNYIYEQANYPEESRYQLPIQEDNLDLFDIIADLPNDDMNYKKVQASHLLTDYITYVTDISALKNLLDDLKVDERCEFLRAEKILFPNQGQ